MFSKVTGFFPSITSEGNRKFAFFTYCSSHDLPPRARRLVVAGKVPVARHRKCSLRSKRFRAFWLSFHFSRGQNRESRSSIFLCSETEKRKRLLRRLWEMWFQWTVISWQKKRETRTLLVTASLLIKTFILSWTHFVHRIISVAKPSCRQKRIPLRNGPSTKTYSDSTGCTCPMAW